MADVNIFLHILCSTPFVIGFYIFFPNFSSVLNGYGLPFAIYTTLYCGVKLFNLNICSEFPLVVAV